MYPIKPKRKYTIEYIILYTRVNFEFNRIRSLINKLNTIKYIKANSSCIAYHHPL